MFFRVEILGIFKKIAGEIKSLLSDWGIDCFVDELLLEDIIFSKNDRFSCVMKAQRFQGTIMLTYSKKTCKSEVEANEANQPVHDGYTPRDFISTACRI